MPNRLLNEFTLAIALTLAVVALNGCNKSDNAGSAPLATSEPTAQVPPKQTPAPNTNDKPGLTIEVFQEDSDMGVAADINRLDDTNKSFFLASVDDSGVAKIKQPCREGDRFAAQPRVDAFLSIRPQACATKITFRLYGAKATYSLIQIADNATRQGNFVLAQANYGLAAERLRYAKPDESNNLDVLANVAAGKILGVHAPTTVIDGKHSVSTEMVEKLKAYQRSINVPESGVLDTATREGISKTPPTAILQKAVETQPTAAVDTSAVLHSTIKVTEMQAVQPSATTKKESAAIRKNLERKVQ
jgi:hypothetical protein